MTIFCDVLIIFTSSALPWCRSFRRLLRLPPYKPCNGELRKVRLWGPPPLFDVFSRVVDEFASLRFLDVEVHEILSSEKCPPAIILADQTPDSHTPEGPSFRLWCPSQPVEPEQKKRRINDDDERIDDDDKRSSTDPEGEDRERGSAGIDDQRINDGDKINSKADEQVDGYDNQVMLIFGQFPKQAGRMDIRKVEELQVGVFFKSRESLFDQIPRGPLLSKLKSGMSIILDKGREVVSPQ